MLSGKLGIMGLGGIAMLVSILLRKKQFPQIPVWKMAILALLLLITGVAGTMILAYIELGRFGGTSYYGAIFFVPILIVPAMLMKITYKDILNMSAPAGCAMLVVMRFNCLNQDCCFGRYLPRLEFQFPSQIAEMVAGIIIMITLIRMYKKDQQVQLYPWYMILYGICRSILQCFRYGGMNPWILGLSGGHLWSLISVLIGTGWLLLSRRRKLAAV